MSDRAIEDAARLLSRGVGLRLDPTIRARLTSAVRAEAESRGLDVSAYVARLEVDQGDLQDLLNRVTVQETSFFRDAGQFAALATHVLPALRSAGVPVVVWSAGCSNGQEAYSLAMALAESGIRDWRVIASDISTKALARVRDAQYGTREVEALSEDRRRRFLAPVRGEQGRWAVAENLRGRVSAVRHNLAADPPPFEPRQCQIVFCRNVLIYFGADDVLAFLERLSPWLDPGAHLFLGYSESLWQVTDSFHPVKLGEAFVYRPGPRPAGPSPADLSPAGPSPGDPSTVAGAPTARPWSSHERRPPPYRPAAQPPIARARPAPATASAGVPGRDPEAARLLAAGESALAAGDHQGAIGAFRKAAFIEPDQPIVHLHLATALEMSGDDVAARRAYTVARSAIDRCDPAVLEATLEGYQLRELVGLLEAKIGQR